jgi:hypothetical protein
MAIETFFCPVRGQENSFGPRDMDPFDVLPPFESVAVFAYPLAPAGFVLAHLETEFLTVFLLGLYFTRDAKWCLFPFWFIVRLDLWD